MVLMLLRTALSARFAPSLLVCGLWLSALAAVAPVSAFGQPDPRAASSAAVVESASVEGRFEAPLRAFRERQEPLTLRNATSQESLFIPISPRMEVQSARLHLEYTNSAALIRERSLLRVSLSGRILAQVALDPDQPNGVLDITLPADLLRDSYNQLTFWVAQHYTLECEDPSAPELYTQIDVDASMLVLEATLRPLNPTLADLEELIDPRLWGAYRLQILSPGSGDDALRWGGLVAQGAALRLRYKSLQAEHQRLRTRVPDPAGETAGWRFPGLDQAYHGGRDLVLVGTASELSGLLAPSVAAAIDGPFLGVYSQDADSRFFVLVVSGNTAEEVSLAARSFAFTNYPLPDAVHSRIEELAVPELPDYSARNVVHENRTYPFTYFDFETETLEGISPGTSDIGLWVPPDFFVRETSSVELSLHFAYGAAMRADSVLNIFLNGLFQDVIYLRNENGEVFRDYRIQIPLRSFRPGNNQISFVPQMMPKITGDCQAIQTRNLVFTLFDDSTLELPDAAHFVEMPDLQRLSATAFPFGVEGDGSGMGMQVLAEDELTIGAAWTLLGRLAQVRGLPLTQAVISQSRPDEDLDWLLVGPAATLTEEILDGAPLKLGEVLEVPHPSAVRQQPDASPAGLLGRLRGWLGSLLELEEPSPALPPEVVRLTQTGGLGRFSLMMEYESPWRSGSTVAVVTAEDGERLYDGVVQLVDPGFWDNLRGDLALWEERSASLRTVSVGERYKVGGLGPQGRMEYFFSKNPWFWTLLLLLLMVLFALGALFLLRRYRQRHHPEVGEESDLDDYPPPDQGLEDPHFDDEDFEDRDRGSRNLDAPRRGSAPESSSLHDGEDDDPRR